MSKSYLITIIIKYTLKFVDDALQAGCNQHSPYDRRFRKFYQLTTGVLKLQYARTAHIILYGRHVTSPDSLWIL